MRPTFDPCSPRAVPRASQDQAEIDAVVLDDHGQTVEGLTANQFQIEDDGLRMPIDSFREVSASGTGGRGDARTVVLVLDDTAVPPTLTSRVQQIARLFVDRMGPSDRLSVVRFNNRTDEAAGNRSTALDRIADYHAGAIPFFGRETFENALKMVTKLSRRFEDAEPRREVIVCIGAPRVFDVKEPLRLKGSLLWPYWVEALAAASRANASLYVLDPAGVTGRIWVTGSGVAEHTGGTAFANTSDFEHVVDQIWREAGHYYLLGYGASLPSGRLHDVRVNVAGHGLHVRARRSRG